MIAQTLFLGSHRGAVPVIVIFGLALYMLPTMIGAVRKVVNVGSVFAINLLLGWTLIGWAIALAMALRTNPPHAYPQMWTPPPTSGPVPGYGTASSPWQSPNLSPSIPPPAGPPAGWYADPSDPSSQRWWDGQRSTKRRRSLNRLGPRTARRRGSLRASCRGSGACRLPRSYAAAGCC